MKEKDAPGPWLAVVIIFTLVVIVPVAIVLLLAWARFILQLVFHIIGSP